MDEQHPHPVPTVPPPPPVLAVIPARGGSKGIPRKNLVPLGDRPLVAWSIATALGCALIDRVVVSTDDEDIAACAREHGAEVPFLRPAALAGDSALVGQAVNHVRAGLADEGYHPAVVAVLYPTHPFRPRGLVDTLVERNLAGFRHVVTVSPMMPAAPGYLIPAGKALPADAPLYRPYGLYDGTTTGIAPLGKHLHTITDPVALMDIDTPADMKRAQAMIDAGLISLKDV